MTRTGGPPRDDAGFTMVELMTAVAIFGVLMIFVGSATLSGFSAVRDIWTRTTSQADAQISAEWIVRQLRHTDIPEGESAAITAASANSITFYTYSGSGTKHDVPYQIKVFVTTTTGAETIAPCLVTTTPTSGAKWKNLCSSVSTPTRRIGGWTWPAAVPRMLMRVPAASGSPITLSVWATKPKVVPRPTPTAVTTTLPVVSPNVTQYVAIQVGDPAEPRSLVKQQIRLENLE